MKRFLIAASALALLSGCQTVTETVGGWWDDWFGSGNPKEVPSALVEFKPTAAPSVRARAGIGGAGGSVFVPAMAQDAVYVAGFDGKIARLDGGSLQERWRINAGKKLSGGVGAGDNLVVVGTQKGEVLAYDASGKPVWQARASSEILAPPAVAEGLVVVRSGDSRVFAFDAKDGTRKWVYQRSTPALTVRSFAGVTIDKNAVFAGFGGGKLVALEINKGIVGWEASVALPRGVSELERIADITSNAVVDGRQICAAAYQGRVTCLDLPTGNVNWARDVSSLAGLTIDSRAVYVSDSKGVVHAFDKSSGAYFWKQDKLLYRQLSAPLVYRGYVVVGDLQGYVHFLSREDGSFAARIATDGTPIRAQPIAFDGGVLVQTKNGGVFVLKLD